MKEIIFGFSRPRCLKRKFYALLIIWRDRKNYKPGEEFISHGYTRFQSIAWGTSFIYQNSGHSTNFESEDRFLKTNIEVEEFALPVSDEIYNAIGKLCVEREGLPYGLAQVAGKALIYICSLVRLEISNPFSRGDAETDCIEEQSKLIMAVSGVVVPFDMDSVSVKAYRDWVAKLPGVRKL